MLIHKNIQPLKIVVDFSTFCMRKEGAGYCVLNYFVQKLYCLSLAGEVFSPFLRNTVRLSFFLGLQQFNSFIIVTCHQNIHINLIHYILQYGPANWAYASL